jgi:hypothetical protein
MEPLKNIMSMFLLGRVSTSLFEVDCDRPEKHVYRVRYVDDFMFKTKRLFRSSRNLRPIEGYF